MTTRNGLGSADELRVVSKQRPAKSPTAPRTASRSTGRTQLVESGAGERQGQGNVDYQDPLASSADLPQVHLLSLPVPIVAVSYLGCIAFRAFGQPGVARVKRAVPTLLSWRSLALGERRAARNLSAGFAVLLCVALTVFSGMSAAAATAHGADANGVWHAPQRVAVSLNTRNFAQTTAISCGSPGNCGAVGSYESETTGDEAFVVNEVNGIWGSAKTVPSNDDDYYILDAISCPSAGNCTAVGEIENISAFVMDETNGTWGQPMDLAAGTLDTVSCKQAGDCVAGGTFGYGGQAYLVTETDGTWGTSEVVPGSLYVDATITTISCPSIGNCAAGGNYDAQPYGPLPGVGYPFVVDETDGSWGSAMRLSGPFDYTDDLDGVDNVTSISCSSPGNCGAGGFYGAFQGFQQAFVATETDGTWGTAREVAGFLDLGKRGYLQSVSCPSNGNFVVAGTYLDRSADWQAFVVNEVAGTWQPAQEVSGIAQCGWLRVDEFCLVRVNGKLQCRRLLCKRARGLRRPRCDGDGWLLGIRAGCSHVTY